MSQITILPEDLANQIAAGEVVERPASVVKEFVENSLDAGARHIGVEVEGGGTRLIRVLDDGQGMEQDDVLLSLERHATSKLRELADLAHITTLGFRGEAVPSIASVSRLTITSRRQGDELGTSCEVRYGQVRKIHEMGCGQGTMMEVRDLFGNVPARKKFLKSKRTELLHIEETVVNAALAHPQIAFRYQAEGRELLNFAENDEPAHRIATLYKKQGQEPLVEVDQCHETAEGVVAVRGWFMPPAEAAPASAKMRLFVAGRPVRDRMVSHAVSEGMHGFLGKGKRPVGVLFVELPPAAVDVNVHPAKQEVRFHKGQLIHQLVSQSVRQAMVDYQQQVKYSLFGSGKEAGKQQVRQPELVPPAYTPAPMFSSAAPITHVEQPAVPEPSADSEPVPAPERRAAPEPGPVPQAPATKSSRATVPAPAQPVADEKKMPELAVQDSVRAVRAETAEAGLQRPRYLGQLAASYLLCESEQGLLVVDQHAAHERLLFERLRRHYLERRLARQSLLFPEMVECSALQSEVLEQRSEEIGHFGLDIEHFGGQSWVIKAIPALLAALPPLEIFHGLLASFVDEMAADKRLEDVLASMACKAAIKAHDSLNQQEGEALIQQMVAADIFSHCPHGRPVVRLFSPNEIKAWFNRS